MKMLENYNPTISIVTAVKNCEATILKTINSVLEQEIDSIEHIIIEGCSTDNTIAIINQHNYGKLKAISEHDNGIYEAMDKGRSIASGDFLFFLNAGDTFVMPDVLKNVLNQIKLNGKLDEIYYGRTIINSKNKQWYMPPVETNAENISLSRNFYPHHQSIFYPKSFYSTNAYDTRFVFCGDIDFTIRACNTFTANYLDFDTCSVFLGGSSTKKANLNIVLNYYKDEQLLHKKHPNVYTTASQYLLPIKFGIKYLTDITMGSDIKHELLYIAHKLRWM
jgi:glycosyltransferase involved in cell wall biosynthesis